MIIFNLMKKMKNFFGIVLLLILVAACGNQKEQVKKVANKSEFTIAKQHPVLENLKPNTSRKIDDWQEYRAFKDFLQQYKSISPNEALNNSRELNDLAKSLKDSVKPEFLELNSFNARVNHLYNETLRLNDMSAISSIKYKEVNEQVSKVTQAFSSVNSKINTLVLQEELDALVNDPKFGRKTKDSLTLDQIDASEFDPKKAKKKYPGETLMDRQMRILERQRLEEKKAFKQKSKKKGNKSLSTNKLPIYKLDANKKIIAKKLDTAKKKN